MAAKRRNLAYGAIAGAVLVALLAGLLGEWVRSLAHPAILIGFCAIGAVLGAFASGVVAYERVHDAREPEEPESGLHALWRRHGAGLVRLPLAPWI